MDNVNLYIKKLNDFLDGTLLILDMNDVPFDMTQDEKFDVIRSDKILDELSKDEMLNSLREQNARLNTGGKIFHSFWRLPHKEDEISKIFERQFEILDLEIYTEKSKNDSFYIIAQKCPRIGKVMDERLQIQKKLKGARITEGNSNGRFEFNEIDRDSNIPKRKSVKEYFKN